VIASHYGLDTLAVRRCRNEERTGTGQQSGAPRLLTAFSRYSGSFSVDDCGVDELLDEPAVVSANGAWCLTHVDRDKLLLRIDPEIGPRIAGCEPT
jgi:hypothetical protein